MKQHQTTFMKNIKHILAVIVIILISWLNIKYIDGPILIIVGSLLSAALLFNFSIRKELQFKSYFLNKYNFLVSTHFSKSQTEISSELMYEKMLEVLQDSRPPFL